jgi:hypothetical protein
MRTKVTFATGFATGYVLGSRAGRARYEQIREAARALARNPAVQSTATQLQTQATDVLATAKGRATDRLGDTWQDKKPAWLGHSESDSAPGGGVAGSNGRPG